MAIAHPNGRPAPTIRPVRPPPSIGCALPPPAKSVTLIADPMRDVKSYMAFRPVNIDALFHRQMPARDLRLAPHLYNWLEFGLAPGWLVPDPPIFGGGVITRKIPSQSGVSNDLATTSVGKISAARLFSPKDILLILDRDLFDGLVEGIYSRRPDHLSHRAIANGLLKYTPS